MRPTRSILATLAALALAVPAAGEPSKTPPPQPDGPVAAPDTALDYRVIDQGLRAFLQVLAADTGTRIVPGPELRGRITDATLSGDMDAILDRLAETHRIDWFAFNGVVHISGGAEATTRLVRLGDLPAARARAALAEMDLPFDRFGLREAADGKALIVSGPPRLLAIVEATIETLPDPKIVPAQAKMFRIRRGTQISLEPAIGADVQPPVAFGTAPEPEPEPEIEARVP